jgi:hypothetical protein
VLYYYITLRGQLRDLVSGTDSPSNYTSLKGAS